MFGTVQAWRTLWTRWIGFGWLVLYRPAPVYAFA